MLILFFPMFSFDPLENMMFSEGSKQNSGEKRVRSNSNIGHE